MFLVSWCWFVPAGSCDEGCVTLAAALGWEKELQQLQAEGGLDGPEFTRLSLTTRKKQGKLAKIGEFNVNSSNIGW